MGSGAESADRIHAAGGENPSGTGAQALVTVALNLATHNFKGICCDRSQRVREFVRERHPEFIEKEYCKIFVLPDPRAPETILGFYTLSPGLVDKTDMSNRDQRAAIRGLPIPMFLVGYLGRDDGCSKDLSLGGVLIRDAALRVALNPDIACWGLYLDAENEQLARWYEEKMLFRRTKSDPLKLYATLSTLLAA
jgi:hypothetical protein